MTAGGGVMGDWSRASHHHRSGPLPGPCRRVNLSEDPLSNPRGRHLAKSDRPVHGRGVLQSFGSLAGCRRIRGPEFHEASLKNRPSLRSGTRRARPSELWLRLCGAGKHADWAGVCYGSRPCSAWRRGREVPRCGAAADRTVQRGNRSATIARSSLSSRIVASSFD